MQFIRAFFKRITDDLKQKKLIPLKILFFVHASTLFVLYPYLTIHMRELGINVEETAIMSAVTPVVSIVMPPLAGMVADKIGNFRVSALASRRRPFVPEAPLTFNDVYPQWLGITAFVNLLLAISSALGGLSALLLLAVPVGRIIITFPTEIELLASCDKSALHLQQVRDYPCQPLHPYAYDINLTVLSCGFVCELPYEATSQEKDSIVHAHSYDVHFKSQFESQRLVYRNTISTLLNRRERPMKDHSTSRILINDPYFNTTPSKVGDKKVFFPVPQLYEIDCSYAGTNATCIFEKKDFINDSIQESEKEKSFRVRITHDAQKDSAEVRNYWVNAVSLNNFSKTIEDYDGIDTTSCKDSFTQDLGESIWVKVGPQRLTHCEAACAASAPRKMLCANRHQQIELDPSFTFWAYLSVRVFIGIISGTAFAMFEGAVISIVRDQKADYGLQRVYGSIGGMISSPLSGLLIDYASSGKGYTDFRPAFYLYAVLKVVSGVLMLSIDLEFKQPAQNLLEDVISVFRNVEIVALFIACFIMGTAWGYIESFLFWLLQDLGASRSLMGITITVGGIAGLPLLVLSGPIINKLGHANVLFIGFVFYAIRLMGYSLIYNPWLCLVFEALESVTSSLSFTAAVTYAARLSSTTTDTSVQGLLGGLYYGVGKGSGSLIGGYLMKFFGTRPTYQIFAAATFITGCFYYLFNKFYIGKRAKGDENDICKKKPTTQDVESRDDQNKDLEKPCTPLDVVSKTEVNKNLVIEVPKAFNSQVKLTSDSVDGSSDSGFDNPAYNENDCEISANDTKKDVKSNV